MVFASRQCFRYEKQQRGRLREHYQLNCDIIGDDSLGADVETDRARASIFCAASVSTAEDFVVRISDRDFWTDLLAAQRCAGQSSWHRAAANHR